MHQFNRQLVRHVTSKLTVMHQFTDSFTNECASNVSMMERFWGHSANKQRIHDKRPMGRLAGAHLSWSQVDRKIPRRQENAGSWQPDWIIMANMARTTDEMLENANSSFKQVHQAGQAWLPVHLGSFIGWDSQMYVPSPCWKIVAISLQRGINN